MNSYGVKWKMCSVYCRTKNDAKSEVEMKRNETDHLSKFKLICFVRSLVGTLYNNIRSCM